MLLIPMQSVALLSVDKAHKHGDPNIQYHPPEYRRAACIPAKNMIPSIYISIFYQCRDYLSEKLTILFLNFSYYKP